MLSLRRSVSRVDIVSAFRKMSTRPDQVHIANYFPIDGMNARTRSRAVKNVRAITEPFQGSRVPEFQRFKVMRGTIFPVTG